MSPKHSFQNVQHDCSPCTTLLIQEHFREIIEFLKFNVFKPSEQKFWVTIEQLTLSQLDFQRNKNILVIQKDDCIFHGIWQENE